MQKLVQQILQEIGPGKMSSVAYDTAWVARLGEIDSELSNQALNWLCENQLPDGSWGAKSPFYYHDRVISTLAAMVALTHRGRRSSDHAKIEKGLLALERITDGATHGLQADPNGATVGFEMIVPTLVVEAEKLGILKQQSNRILGRLQQLRTKKLEMIKGHKINKYITPSFSIEMVGAEGKELLELDKLQEQNGSIANSPSATAFYCSYVKPGDQAALSYLRNCVLDDGGAPDFSPIDIFEVAWTLWNLKLIPNLEETTMALFKPHLDFLYNSWNLGLGIGTASNGTIKDGDDTGLAFEVLSFFGYKMDIDAILKYEEDSHFRCFSLEANPSLSANIHVLGALRQAGFEKSHKSVRKVLEFLKLARQAEGYWFDKWHTSPYYTTSHAIMSVQTYDDDLCREAIAWILKTQNPDGSWGSYDFATAEETAYAIQALTSWQKYTGHPLQKQIEHGIGWLKQNSDLPYPSLWIGKGLYMPNMVVRSAIASALLWNERK
jgi:halimadienyl-diphosphate synthase